MTHQNWKWEGWDSLELNEFYRREARDRRRLEKINADGIKEKTKPFIVTKARNFKEAVNIKILIIS